VSAVVLALTGCSHASPHLTDFEAAPPPAPPAMPGQLVFVQAQNDVVSPSKMVAVGISDGTLQNVTLVDAAGNAVPGSYDAQHLLWRNAAPLAYGTQYKLTATGTGDDGVAVQGIRDFTTVQPGGFESAEIRAFRGYGPALDGGTFGVGQPVVIEFDRNIPDSDKAAVEKSLEVKSSPPTEGAWKWIQDDEIHWRPKQYWLPGTKVTVDANLFGTNMGNGYYGQANLVSNFTIGDSKIAIADHDSKLMRIYINGVDVSSTVGQPWDPNRPGFTYDHSNGARISMGAEGMMTSVGWFDRRTSSGPHVVLEKSLVVRMQPDLPKTDPNYYSELVPYAVRITFSGLYVHWADWSVYDQGVRNVSHGCINMSPNDAVWFYNTFSYGDIVDVRNTGKPQDLTDGLGDWGQSWDQWLAA
jgi:lipoprotein-anchoring transpeptidase ErfK/SrfK